MKQVAVDLTADGPDLTMQEAARIAARRAQGKGRRNRESCSALLNLVTGAESNNSAQPSPTLAFAHYSCSLGTPSGTPDHLRSCVAKVQMVHSVRPESDYRATEQREECLNPAIR